MSKRRRSLATTKGKDTSRRAKPLVEELVIWVDENNISTDALKFGTFEQKSIITTHNIPIGYKYFCPDKQSIEGGTDGIEIIHKRNNIWVDALSRVVF